MSSGTDLRALVVFESMFGNTEKVAHAVTGGLELEGAAVVLTEVTAAPMTLDPDLDLLVVGAPTHAFGLSRPRTRADAVRQGAPGERADVGLREWVAAAHVDRAHAPPVAAFDTRVTRVRWLPRAAGTAATRLLRVRALKPLDKPVGFLVADLTGPPLDGETERAVAWGRHLARRAQDRWAVA